MSLPRSFPLLGLSLVAGLACPSGTEQPVGPIAVQLALAVAPLSTAQSGLPLPTQPVIQVEDGEGQPFAEAGRLIVAVLATSGGSLSGTLQLRTDAAGRAAFTDLVVSGPAGAFVLRFDSPGLRSITTGTLQLSAGTAVGLAAFSGNFQNSIAGTPVPLAPAVRVTDAAGNPVPNVPVVFVASAGGSVEGGTTSTNASGIAAPTKWTLAFATGINTLTATSSALPGSSVSFTATGTLGPPAALSVAAGEAQSAAVGGDVPVAPAVKLSDAVGHPLPGVAVTFTLASGGGSITGANALTDAAGIATLGSWTLGLVPGPNTLTVSRSGVPSLTLHATGLIFPVLALSAGTGHSCALDPAGTAFCWGTNSNSQLGNGAAANLMVPTAVSGGLSFTAISAGNGHSCGVAVNGDAYCWGANDAGQLGDGTLVPHPTPNLVAGGFQFVGISASSGFTCGLLTDGSARCWGFGANGQIGDGATLQRSLPTLVFGGHTFAAVSAGASHACALDTSGALYCWGFNGNGRLGDGTTTNRNVPTLVNSFFSFSAISAGGSHSCAITTAGAGYCWGSGASGRLGNGATTDQSSPAAISGGLGLSGISAHASHSCAVTTSQLAFCWGLNGSGELGDGTITTRLVPTAVAGGLSFTVIVAGAEHSCARATSGGAYCWGRNDAGAVGDGTIIGRTRPVGVVKP